MIIKLLAPEVLLNFLFGFIIWQRIHVLSLEALFFNYLSKLNLLVLFCLKVTESFNTGDSFSQVPVQVPQLEEKVMTLRKPPKWIRKPVGATFAVSAFPQFVICFKFIFGV